MSKSVSYYDWELRFKKKGKHETRKNMVQTRLVENKNTPNGKNPKNSLGISESDYRQFIEEWKKKNLP
ncbi:MAG: hypothetical protein R6U96_14975 [Promethearchaeia archaeon]